MGSINRSVDLRRDGEVAVVAIDHPPVNALKHEARGHRRGAALPDDQRRRPHSDETSRPSPLLASLAAAGQGIAALAA
jgi:hypothetical protein